eukprot:1905977-Amphidinium_carterae.1
MKKCNPSTKVPFPKINAVLSIFVVPCCCEPLGVTCSMSWGTHLLRFLQMEDMESSKPGAIDGADTPGAELETAVAP